MAWMSQAKKKVIAANLKEAMKGTGMKYSLAVRNHSTLVLTFISGPVDFRKDFTERVRDINPNEPYHYSVNPYWFTEHLQGKSLDIVKKAYTCLMDGNHDRSDIQTDYFDVGWYVDINVGTWDKPYQVTA